MHKVISFTLDSNSITRAIDELYRYSDEFLRKMNDLQAELVKQGKQECQMRIAFYDAVDTGSMMNSVDGYYSPSLRTGFIRVNSTYAAFVEYGTGIIGEMNPHPNPDGWVYDVNGHGWEGWDYYKDGKMHHTAGYQSRPFFYETFLELENICHDIARSVFR